ncbi:hypothetical protein C8R41DRAFT_592169 [Lentinula lateritia]|uniref:Transmembrane protein n=1 Tax=Lentinula lateritia TaxID=40482 RepID=A0ABQ8V6L3_9AGAR|nr:hypothetical protein C8R41DRAFT_592169 [Lentinula lateritia]
MSRNFFLFPSLRYHRPTMSTASTKFSSEALQVVVFLVLSLGLCLTTHCLSRSVTTARQDSKISCARLFLMLVFASSWLFVFINQLLIFGITLQFNDTTCKAAAHVCAVLYGVSKAFMYLFLAEKVHTVWSPIDRRRFSSPQYKICFFSLVLYALPAVSLLSNSLHKIRVNDGVCVLELVHYAAYYLVAYDIYVTTLFTALFLWPLLNPSRRHPFVRRIALRTLCASIIALTSSTANAVIFVLLKNSEVGWVCFITCAIDVIVNSVTLFWVSHYGLQNDEHARGCSRSQSNASSIQFKSFFTTQNSNNLESKSSDVAAEMAASEPPLVPLRPLEVPIVDVNANQPHNGPVIQDKDSKVEEIDHHVSDFSPVSRSTDPEAAIVAIRTGSAYVDVETDEIDSFTGPQSVVFASMPPVSQTDPSDHTRTRSLSSSISSVSLPVLIVRGRVPDTGPSAILSGKL